jgi:hypothetical protein
MQQYAKIFFTRGDIWYIDSSRFSGQRLSPGCVALDKKLFQHTPTPLRGKGIGVSATSLGIADASAS